MIKYNELIKRNQFDSEFKETGEYWHFDNGQYGEKTPIKQCIRIHLTYHYNRVYFNFCYVRDCGNTAGGPGSQTPLSNIKDPERLEAARQLFEADKKAGIIPESYIFC